MVSNKIPNKKSTSRVDMFWDAIKTYKTAFKYFTKLPIDFDPRSRRLIMINSFSRVLPWLFMAYFITGLINCAFKFYQAIYLHAIPTSLTGISPKRYEEFKSLYQLLSIPVIVIMGGSSPVFGFFIFYFGREATGVVNAILELEETLENRKFYYSIIKTATYYKISI